MVQNEKEKIYIYKNEIISQKYLCLSVCMYACIYIYIYIYIYIGELSLILYISLSTKKFSVWKKIAALIQDGLHFDIFF